jgi:3-deoxy-D-manno-octulosonate 8-phosphate phosphatase (KDO 8-P phosphatase)
MYNGDISEKIKDKAAKIKLVLTDVDGVLTDAGVYFSDTGEVMKRFSIRDGMGVERMRELCGIETGIVTGEISPSVTKRAEKLKISDVYLGAKNKLNELDKILKKKGLKHEEIAFIGDDTNDIEIMKMAGLSACPSDGTTFAKMVADYICNERGGHGAFREFAEFIIAVQLSKT